MSKEKNKFGCCIDITPVNVECGKAIPQKTLIEMIEQRKRNPDMHHLMDQKVRLVTGQEYTFRELDKMINK